MLTLYEIMLAKHELIYIYRSFQHHWLHLRSRLSRRGMRHSWSVLWSGLWTRRCMCRKQHAVQPAVWTALLDSRYNLWYKFIHNIIRCFLIEFNVIMTQYYIDKEHNSVCSANIILYNPRFEPPYWTAGWCHLCVKIMWTYTVYFRVICEFELTVILLN